MNTIRHIERLAELAREAAVIGTSLAKLRKGEDGAALHRVANVIELELDRLIASTARRRRRAKGQGRSGAGRFVNG